MRIIFILYLNIVQKATYGRSTEKKELFLKMNASNSSIKLFKELTICIKKI